MPEKKFSFIWEDLEDWAAHGLINPDQLVGIRAYLESTRMLADGPSASRHRKGLNLLSLAYYFGAFMILFAYTIFMGVQWEKMGMGGQVAVSGLTIAILWAIGYFLRRKNYQIPGGLLIFAGTGIVPLFVFSLQRASGLWPDTSTYNYRDFYQIVAQTWVLLEVVSMAVAVLVIFLARFPLISLLIAFWGWFLSMDIARWVTQSPSWSWSEQERVVSILVGLAMLGLGILLQCITKQDYSFWFYLFGQITVFTGVISWSWVSDNHQLISIGIGAAILVLGVVLQHTMKPDHSPLFYFFGHLIVMIHLSNFALSEKGIWGLAYFVVYLVFVIASVWLQRRIFLVFGAIGVYGYLSYLAFQVFEGTLGFTFALASMGLLIILTAVGYQKYTRPWLERQFAAYRLDTAELGNKV